MFGQAHRENNKWPVQACPIEFGSILLCHCRQLVLHIFRSLYLFFRLSIYLSMYLCIHLSISLCISTVMLMGCVATKFKWRVTATVELRVVAPNIAQAPRIFCHVTVKRAICSFASCFDVEVLLRLINSLANSTTNNMHALGMHPARAQKSCCFVGNCSSVCFGRTLRRL